MNRTIQTRQEITAQICRVILWIDEEILPKDTSALGDKYRTFFHPISQDLQEKGYLIHLHPFEQSTSDSDDPDDPLSEPSSSLKSACELSNKADLVILDWHLGYQDSPEHSVKILENLLANQGTRFVIILSKRADDFRSEMQDHGLLGDGQFSEIPDIGNPSWTSPGGTHISLLSKTPDGNTDITAQEILDSVYSLISHTYPDYLHWAALEIAGKFRRHFPQWLNDLPKGTDIAVMQELLNAQSEIREYLPENLLEDFVEIARTKSLESLRLENADWNSWINRPDHLKPLRKKTSGTDRLLHVHTSAKKLTAKDFDIYEFLEEIEGTEEGNQWVQSNSAFLEFCEVSSNSATTEAPNPGSLYKNNDDENSIFVCASQACDCARKTTLLLLKGEATDEIQNGSTSLRHQNQTFRIDPTAENLTQVTVSESETSRTLDGYSKIGQLRPAIAARIISRFWSGNTRPAVNHPNFARAVRKGE